MKFKHSLIYTALFAVPVLVSAEEAQLDQVEVSAQIEKVKASDKLKDTVNLSLLGRQSAFNSAINVVNYDEKILNDQNARNVLDAVAKTDSSVINFGGETNTLSGIYVRGLQLDARQISVNGLSGLYSTYNSPIAAVSSAQLIKGASTATTGMDPEGAAGSSLNIETKRATDDNINKIGLGWFSNNRVQETFDLGRRFGANNEWGIRVNGRYRDGDTARNNYDERNKELAVGADYRGDKLRVGLDYMITKRDTTGGRARVQDIQELKYALPVAPSGDINLNPRWIGQVTEDQTMMATFEYDLPFGLMLSGGLGTMESDYTGSFGQINGKNVTQAGQFTVTGIRGINFHARTNSANLKLQGEAETGPVSHNWSLAFDAVQRTRDHLQTYKKNVNGYGSLRPTSLYNPTFVVRNSYDKGQWYQQQDQKLKANSVALADTLGFFENTLRLTLGGRYQWIKQTDALKHTDAKESRFSPMVALAYSPVSDLMFYSNYLEDLEPGAVDEDSNTMAKPIVSRQVEFGVRKNWGEALSATLSAYQLSRPGIVNKTGNGYTAGKEQGKERNRGIEFNIYASLFNKTLRPVLGITYNQGKLIDYPTYDPAVNGPVVNTDQVSSPRIIGKAGIEWDTPFVNNLTLNAAVQYYGKSYQDVAKKYKFPAYTTVDFGAKYVVKLSGKQAVTLRAAVENAFNKNYWQVQRGRYDRSFAMVGLPRTYWANVEYSF